MFFFMHPSKGDFHFLSPIIEDLLKKLTLTAMEINSNVIFGHWSFVTGHLSFVICHSSLVIGTLPNAPGSMLLSLPSVLCPLSSGSCSMLP